MTDPLSPNRVVAVRMEVAAWELMVKAVRVSPMAGNYLVAAGAQGIEDTLAAVRGSADGE